MHIKLRLATPDDVRDLVALRTAASVRLAQQFGQGYWAPKVTEKGMLYAMRIASVYVATFRSKPIATLTLSTRKPWAIDKKYFTPVRQSLYLTAMAVSPDHQRSGLGSACLEESCRIARAWPADAIRLDAYDVAAGAGEFYRKCGFRHVGGATYRGTALLYFEKLL
jgi:GNAT superfamily N-acetyltransferase